MAKLIVSEFVTLDGVIEAPGGEPTHPHAGWVMDHIGPEQNDYKLAEVRGAGSLLLGRTTDEGFSGAWPDRDGEFADKMNSMPKYVVSSSSSTPLPWENSQVVTGDITRGVAALKESETDPILVAGSGTLVKFLLANDLVDELRMMVFPVLAGDGLRCFPESLVTKKTLQLAGVIRSRPAWWCRRTRGAFELAALDHAVVRRSDEQREDLGEVTGGDDVPSHVRVMILDRPPTFREHELVRVVTALEELERLAPVGGDAAAAALLEEGKQRLGIPVGGVKVHDDLHTHRRLLRCLPARRFQAESGSG